MRRAFVLTFFAVVPDVPRLKDKPPLDLLEAWIDESYGGIAPKKLVASLD